MSELYFNNLERIGKKLVKDKDVSIRNYVTYMLNRTQQVFEYEGLPNTIPKQMLEMMLQAGGLVGFGLYNGKLYAFQGGYGGYPDAYYRPTLFIVANPYLKFNKQFNVFYNTMKDELPNINVDDYCVIMGNDSMHQGLLPLFNKYASLLTENDITLRIADINMRLTTLISAADDKTKNAALEYLREVEKGNLGVLGDNKFLESLTVIPSTSASFSNYITQLIEYEQYLKASWYNEIGLNSNYNMKRESLNSSETGANRGILLPLIDDMMWERNHAIEKINLLFGTNINVKFSSAWEDIREEIKLEHEEMETETKDEVEVEESPVESSEEEVDNDATDEET